MRVFPLLLLFALAGCDSIAPAPRPPSTGAFPGSTVIQPAAEQQMALAQVDVHGTVTAPGAPEGKLIAVLTDGPCFAVGSHYLGSLPVRAGVPYTLQIFPPRGTRLDACAALVVGGNRATPWHGRSGKSPLVSAGSGSVTFQEVDITVARGEPINLPSSLPLD